MPRPRRSAIGSIVALAVLSGCGSGASLVTTPPGWRAAQLTRDGEDHFRARLDDATVTVTADDDNVDTNSRMVLWPRSSPGVGDSEACVSFTDEGWPAQEGIAVRVAPGSDGVRLVTVTKNVWDRASDRVNVHVWDTATSSEPREIDSFDATAVDGSDGPAPYPWSMCVRVIGDELDATMWPSDRDRPSWDDRAAVHRTTLPGDVPATGSTGLYVGHLAAGRSARITMDAGFGR